MIRVVLIGDEEKIGEVNRSESKFAAKTAKENQKRNPAKQYDPTLNQTHRLSNKPQTVKASGIRRFCMVFIHIYPKPAFENLDNFEY